MAYRLSEEHPLQPIRVKLAVELMLELGLVEFAELVPPRVATDEEIALCHSPRYIELVKAFSRDPFAPSRAGIGPGDTPAFAGMHEASAAVAGGSLRAMEAILRGEVLHAFHPGGGLK